MMAGYKSRIRGNWLISLETESFLFPTYLFLLLLFLSSYQKKKEGERKNLEGWKRKNVEGCRRGMLRRERIEKSHKKEKEGRKNERKRQRKEKKEEKKRRTSEIDSFSGNLFDNLNKAMNVTFM